VRLLSQIVAFVLLALWMPATQHCGLEAAGILATHAEDGAINCCDAADVRCSYDGCQIVEQLVPKSANDSLQVLAPDFVVCTCFICVQLVTRDLNAAPATPAVAINQPRGWVPTWHFARRSAPLSRAPSILV
jgi:hypothetical protein